MSTILIIEDETRIAAFVAKGLKSAGFTSHATASGVEGATLAVHGGFDLVVLDVGLPDIDGFEVLERIRGQGVAVPVILLTARSSVADRVAGLEGGADDYMLKPFELPELLARLRALLRRSQAATTAVLSLGPLEMDTALRRVNLAGQTMELGPREWTVLEYLLLQAPKPAAKDKLLAALTGWDKEITPNAIEVYVSRLRAKLEPAGVALRSIRGFGYRLELLPPSAHAREP